MNIAVEKVYFNVKSNGQYPNNVLSNFHSNGFIFDGVECASMEGLLQSFKYKDIKRQRELCKLVGLEAKSKGSKRTKIWQDEQTLWWNGYVFPRTSRAYQNLLDEAFENLFNQNAVFRGALERTGDYVIKHTMGSKDVTKTILTEDEFCSRLMKLRKRLQDD